MSLTGPDAMRALDDALRDIRREEDEIMRKLGRSAERIAKIRETEGELLRQFAQGRLSAEQEVELGGRIVQAGLLAREELKERTAEMAVATERLKRLDAELGELVAERAAALTEVDRQQAGLRGLSPRIAAAIARDPGYETQQQEAARLKAVAAAARAKARQADIDREQKGRPYRGDPLFAYLLQRGYGTPAYRARALVARLDGWVARQTDYATAARHYAMLNALPGPLHAHAERQVATAAAAEDAIDDVERSAIDTAGGAAWRSALAAAQGRIAEIDARIIAIQDDRDAMTKAQTRLADTDDAAFDGALRALVAALGATDIQALVGAARVARPGPDDPLIAQLDDARLRVLEVRIDARDEHMRLRTLASRRRELEDIEYELKAQKFDDPRSLFRDVDLVAGRLNGFLTGATSAEAYWLAWQRSQSWSAGTSDWGGGVGLPRHGRQAGGASAPPEADGFRRPRQAVVGANA